MATQESFGSVTPIMGANRFVTILGGGNEPTEYTEKDFGLVYFLVDT